MPVETALLMLALAAAAAVWLFRRRRHEFRSGQRQEMVECVVEFYDRRETLPLIDTFFSKEKISVLDFRRDIDRSGEHDRFINTYRLRLPATVEQADLVSGLSAFETVQAVHVRPL
ncbi:MAG: hypothetical protein J6K32_11555 [Clostridia bacterium]|nr:hypothetical protein [Clostridia bacterium]